MNFINPDKHTRRAFLRRSSQLALTGTALPFALNLAAMGEAAAFNATDYRALVCVFLFGGNDYANTVINYDDTNYNLYAGIRGGNGQGGGGIAIAKSALTPTLLTPAPANVLAGGRQYALHPSMTRMAGLFNGGKAAVQLNVGPLVVPLTRTQYNNSNKVLYPQPPKLFSHNDQQSVWQSSSPEGSTIGWGGNIGDLAIQNSANTNSLFSCISVSGNAVFLSGDQALQYQVSSNGAVGINGVKNSVFGSTAVQSAMAQLLVKSSGHVMENEYNKVTKRAVDAEAQVTSAIATPMTTAFTANNSLAAQLKMVARMIAGRNVLGAKRQVFFVSMGGFDLHDNLIAQQPALMQRLSDGMADFYQATVDLGISDKVTAFTASDFGRTLASNGDSSDHDWGSHHFMVGGAVKGGAFYGSPPPVSVGNSTTLAEDQWHVGQGRLLPSTAVDQYGATLARWFGVADTEMTGILPNLVNFGSEVGRGDYPRNLGFMA